MNYAVRLAIEAIVLLSIIVGCRSYFGRTNEASEKFPELEIDTTTIDEPYIETRHACTIDKAAAISIIKSFEGFRDTIYKCPNGVPTVGWGTTKCCLDELYRQGYIKDSTYYRWGGSLPKAKADVIVSKAIDMMYASSKKLVPDLKYLSPKAQAAFISWAYQCGIGNVQKKTGIIGVFPDIIDHLDDKMLYDILTERAFYSKYKTRRLKEAALIIGLK